MPPFQDVSCHREPLLPVASLCNSPESLGWKECATQTDPLPRRRRTVTRVYGLLGLRLGTVLIAILDILCALFIGFLLVLGAVHAREVTGLVEADVQARNLSQYMHSLEDSLGLAFDQSMENKLHAGMDLATAMTMLMAAGISLACVDMIASGLLLMGAILHARHLLLPWLVVRVCFLMSLGGLTLGMLVGHARGAITCRSLMLPMLTIPFSMAVIYHCCVVFSLHDHLCRLERTSLYHTIRRANHARQVSNSLDSRVNSAKTC